MAYSARWVVNYNWQLKKSPKFVDQFTLDFLGTRALKPRVYRRCRNPECSIYDKKVELVPEEERWFYISPFCTSCYREGGIRLVHGTIEAESSEAFYAKVGGMAKEFHLLKSC